MPTQQERRTATRQGAVNATIEVLVERGTTQVSLEEIAQIAGVAKSTLIYHFGSRAGLLRDAAVSVVRDLEHRLAAETPGADAETWLRALLAEVQSPRGRMLYTIGDELGSRGELADGDPVPYLGGRLAEFGVDGDPELLAAAVVHLGRTLAYGPPDPAAIDRIIESVQRGARLR